MRMKFGLRGWAAVAGAAVQASARIERVTRIGRIDVPHFGARSVSEGRDVSLADASGSDGSACFAEAAEADVRGGARRLALAAGAHHVADAVVVATQERPAALHPLGHPGLLRVEAGRRAGRVLLRAVLVVVFLVPVLAPLP